MIIIISIFLWLTLRDFYRHILLFLCLEKNVAMKKKMHVFEWNEACQQGLYLLIFDYLSLSETDIYNIYSKYTHILLYCVVL